MSACKTQHLQQSSVRHLVACPKNDSEGLWARNTLYHMTTEVKRPLAGRREEHLSNYPSVELLAVHMPKLLPTETEGGGVSLDSTRM